MFTVYSKDNCSYCVKTYDLLNQKGENYKSVKLDTDEKIQSFVARGFKQVPQIYYGDELIEGGYTGLVKWYADKERAFDE